MRPVNLLPEDLRPRELAREGRGPAHVVLGVLGVLVVLVVVYALSLNQVNSRKTEIAQAKGEIEAAKGRIAASSAFGDFHNVKETRVASIKELASGRFDWERLMRELALVLPDKTWLLDATASTSGDPSSTPGSTPGATPPAASPAAASAGASPTLDLKGCAVHQDDVAVMLVRLRKLYRAENVDLKESAREATDTSGGSGQAAAGDDSCGSRSYRFEVAVTFAPPSDAEKPAGGKVPAKLGGGS
jgi:Tfp pilus assembly protein PilN